MQNPLVSVVIPAFNAQKYIAKTVQSVLDQDYKNVEIIVVNDGSTDATLEELKPFLHQIRVVSQENKGQAVARNVGIQEAKGELIGLLDADDIWPSYRLSIMIPYLLGEASHDVVRGRVKYVRNFETQLQEDTPGLFLNPLVGACLYKKSVFEIVGLFDEQMRQGEDFDWNIRLAESTCKEKKMEEITLFYRRHEDNLTNSQEFMRRGQAEALKKKILRNLKRHRS
jgi:glycosyltransferase involved in cell wall biosynthesis